MQKKALEGELPQNPGLVRLESELPFEWDQALGRGYYHVQNPVYDDAYFDKYALYEETELGRTLTNFRANLVRAFKHGMILDVGIGSGAFIKALFGSTAGFDICPKAVSFLQKFGLFCDPYLSDRKFKTLTFFDSLEHIQHPGFIINKVSPEYVFISIPIFIDKAHVLRSKHFRPDEHYHYFTTPGLCFFMAELGYEKILQSNAETVFGREDIETFVFKKVQQS